MNHDCTYPVTVFIFIPSNCIHVHDEYSYYSMLHYTMDLVLCIRLSLCW